MSRMIWGSCCALLAVVLFAAGLWRPAGADEVDQVGDQVGEKGNAAIENFAYFQETLQSYEIVAKRRINKILDTQLIAPLEYLETPLVEILDILQDDYDLLAR